MLDETRPGAWLVRHDAEAPPEAFVDRFTRGYKLSSWSLIESERHDLGVYMSKELAETAWWRRRESSSRLPSS